MRRGSARINLSIRALVARHRLVLALGGLLVVGFVAVNATNYCLSSRAVRRTLVENELPLTSDNLYSEIQASLIRPIRISSLMAHDTFLHDWMVDGEKSPERVVEYLSEIHRQYDVSSTFVVSKRTRRYYHFDGVLKKVSRSSGKDDWFFSMESHDGAYRVDVDRDEAHRGQLTIFVNHKIRHDGEYLGVTGIGLDALKIGRLVDEYRNRYDRNIYFINSEGMVTENRRDNFISRESIRRMPGLASAADEILSGKRGSLTYERNGADVFLRYRYIPELDWYLMVEQTEHAALAPVRRSLYINLAISGAITVIILGLSAYTIQFFHRRLERSARVDELTGLLNRQFFDVLCDQAIRRANRYGGPVSLVLLDVDGFKELNDGHGHLAGDRILRHVADAVRAACRNADPAGRWGGDELIVLLEGCDRESARDVAENIRREAAERSANDPTRARVTVSAGVASRVDGDSAHDLVERADKALYAAKNRGKNRVAPDAEGDA